MCTFIWSVVMKLACLLVCRDGRGFFFCGARRGQARPKNRAGRGRSLNLQGRAGQGIHRLIEIMSYSRRNLDLHCVNEVSQYSTFIITIIIMIIIIVQCCYIVLLRLSQIGKILECHLYFAPPLPRGFDCFRYALKKEKRYYLGIFPNMGGGSSQIPKLL